MDTVQICCKRLVGLHQAAGLPYGWFLLHKCDFFFQNPVGRLLGESKKLHYITTDIAVLFYMKKGQIVHGSEAQNK